MTVPTTTNTVIGEGNGVATVFPFTFGTLPAGNLEVTLFDLAGAGIPQLENTDYTVLGKGAEDGGSVVFVVAPPAGYTVLIQRILPGTQPDDLKNQGSYYPRTVERMIDRVTMLFQQLSETIGRTLRLPPQVQGVSTELPAPDASALIGWAPDNTQLQNYRLADLATNIAYGNKEFDIFAGTGAQVNFTMSRDPGSLGNLDISINGITQVPGADYTYLGTTLTFSAAPANGAVVLVRYDVAVPVGTGLSSAIQYTPPSTGVNGSVQSFLDLLWSATATAGAALVRWIQAGTGGVAQTIMDELRRTVRPEHFGAVGDGVTNDTAAFNRARDYLMTHADNPAGGTLTLTRGRKYAFGSTWTVTKTAGRQFNIDGNGAEFTKTIGGWAGPIMYYGNSVDVAGAYPLVARNMRFQGVGANGTGLSLEWAGGSRLEGVIFLNFVNGLSLTNTFGLHLCNKPQFLDCSTAAILCNTIAHNLTIVGGSFFRNQRDVYFVVGAQAYNLNMIGCDCEGSAAAGSNCVVLDAGGAAINIKGCYIEGKNGNPLVFGANTEAVTFNGNWLGFNTGTQTWNNVGSGVMDGNVFWDQTQALGTAKDFDIGNNSFIGTSNRIFTPWQVPTFTNSFVNTGGTWAGNVAGFRKDRNGVVHLRGMVQSAVGDASAFSLPVGYRPAGLTSWITTSANGGKTDLARVQVSAGGSVTVFRGTDTSGDLSVVSFTAQQ